LSSTSTRPTPFHASAVRLELKHLSVRLEAERQPLLLEQQQREVEARFDERRLCLQREPERFDGRFGVPEW
jgi:hypothetical protein